MIDRTKYVYEGPNGSPRSKRDYSPDTKLRVDIRSLAGIVAHGRPDKDESKP